MLDDAVRVQVRDDGVGFDPATGRPAGSPPTARARSPPAPPTVRPPPRRPQPADALSPRELQVLRLVAKGLSNREIGRELSISEATVKTHLLRAFAKLGVTDRTAAVTTALAAGIDLQ